MNDVLEIEAQQLWKSQPSEEIKMPIEEIRRRAQRFERRIRARNLRESVGSILCALAFGYFMVDAKTTLYRISYGLFIAAMIWVLFQLRRLGTRTMPQAESTVACLDFFRGELARQRDAVKNVWPWYLAPLVPGYVMFSVAFAVATPARWVTLLVLDIIFVGIFIGVWKMNQRAARCLQRSIDELDAARN